MIKAIVAIVATVMLFIGDILTIMASNRQEIKIFLLGAMTSFSVHYSYILFTSARTKSRGFRFRR